MNNSPLQFNSTSQFNFIYHFNALAYERVLGIHILHFTLFLMPKKFQLKLMMRWFYVCKIELRATGRSIKNCVEYLCFVARNGPIWKRNIDFNWLFTQISYVWGDIPGCQKITVINCESIAFGYVTNCALPSPPFSSLFPPVIKSLPSRDNIFPAFQV